MSKKFLKDNKDIILFLSITAMVGLALGLSDSVFSNYFKDAYDVSAYQRGLIEFPRELPGLLCILVIALGSFMGDIRLAMVAQALSIIGVLVLGLVTPIFGVMLIFLFINSMGMHMYMPLSDSIFMSMVKDHNNIGKRMGQYKATNTAFRLVAALIVFVGFKTGLFSLKTEVKLVFLLAAGFFLIALVLFGILNKSKKDKVNKKRSLNLVFEKDYKFYYILAAMNGAQKQIMIVFGPWVLIEILNKGADTIALLLIIGSFIGIFFLRALGKWIDRFGIKNLLIADAISFIIVYALYGLLSLGFFNGTLATAGLPVVLAYVMFILDRMSMDMSMVRVLYLRNIAKDSKDVTPTLSTGISMDHLVSMISAFLGGLAWEAWGPQYVFFIAAGLSFVNLIVAQKVVIKNKEA